MAPSQTTQEAAVGKAAAQPAVQDNTAAKTPAAQPGQPVPGQPGQPAGGFKITWWMWAIVAVVVLGIGIGIYFLLK